MANTIQKILCLAFIVTSLSIPFYSGQGETGLVRLKSSFLLNFLKFAEIPMSGTSRFVVCGFSESDIEIIRKLTDQMVHQRKISPKEVAPGKTQKCQAIYVSSSLGGDVSWLKEESDRMLIVSEVGTDVAPYAHLNFIVLGDSLRFAANIEIIQQSRVLLSSKLLKLAR